MPAASDSTVVVSINGKKYAIALQPGQTPEHVQEVAQFVDAAMQAVRSADRYAPPVHTAILAGLQLAEELLGLQAEYQAAEADIAQRTSRLTASLGRLFEEQRHEALSSERG